MKLGIIADPHLSPAGTRVTSYHTQYQNADVMVAYRLALQRCVREGADGIVLLGDISNSGDTESLEAGVRLAAETGLTVWAVSGNHDCFLRTDAFFEVVRQVRADNVRLARPSGEMVGGRGPRVAGISVTSGEWGYAAGPNGRPDVLRWGSEPVVWLTHYPIISFAEKVWEVGLVYGDELEDLEEVARPLLERSAPTIAVSGHEHLRDASVVRGVLQVACAALVEPPFEVTFLDFELEGETIAVRRETVPLVSSPLIYLPAFSPPQQEWVFEAGTWRSR